MPERIASSPTLAHLFEARAAATPQATAYVEYSRSLGKWFEHSWQAMHMQAGRIQVLLERLGLRPGDRIGIMARGGTYWAGLDLAAAGLGLVTVPLYYRDRAGNVAYVARRSRMRALFLGGEDQWRRLAADTAALADVAHVFSAEDIPDAPVRSFFAELADVPHRPYRTAQAEAEAVATVVFTSGTTGRPKGVMLTHANILSNARAATEAVPIGPADRLLSFLPLSHMFERTAGYYAAMLRGSAVAFARSVHTLRRDLQLQPPTVLVSVPRVYEKIHRALASQAPLDRPAGRALLRLAQWAGRARSKPLRGLLGWLPRLLIGRRVRQGLGGRLRLVITGGAAMRPEVAHFFAGIGIRLLQGYGLTEASPVVSVNRAHDARAATVGPPLAGVETRLDEHRELLVRGPGVMRGYLDDPEATAAAIDAEGWLHTGDLAAREDGHLRIIGRAKEIIVLSTGEKVPPEELENALCGAPQVAQAWVAGEGRPFLSAVVVVEAPIGEAQLRPLLEARLHDFPGYARVRRLHVETEPWTEGGGLLTATFKLRREALQRKYAAVLDAFYD